MARWRGEQPVETEAPDTDELVAAFARSHDALEAFIAPLEDTDLGRDVVIRSLSGREAVDALEDTIVHLVNHSTFHRGEAALLLTEQGRSPGDLDYLDFLDLSTTPAG
jgi:uncharacterized damage-inducible protein DinB